MLRQHGGADGLANGFTIGIADIAAISKSVRAAFDHADRKSVDVAEHLAFRVAHTEPVGVPKHKPDHFAIAITEHFAQREPKLRAERVTVRGPVDLAQQETKHKPERLAEQRAKCGAVDESKQQPVNVPERLAYAGADYASIRGTKREPFFVAVGVAHAVTLAFAVCESVDAAERLAVGVAHASPIGVPEHGAIAQPDGRRALRGARAVRGARVHNRHVLPERGHALLPAVLRQHRGADGVTNGFADGLADIAAIAESVRTTFDQSVAPSFGEPDRKPVDVAEHLAFRVAHTEPVGVPKHKPDHFTVAVAECLSERQPKLQPKRITVRQPIDLAQHEPKQKPDRVTVNEPQPQAFNVAKHLTDLATVGSTERKPVVVAVCESVEDAE